MSHDFIKSSALSHLKIELKKYLNKKRKKNNLEIYLEKDRVAEFQSKVKKALLEQIKGLDIEGAFNIFSKLTSDEKNRVKSVLQKDFTSFGDIIGDETIYNYILDTYNDGGNEMLDSLDISGVFNARSQSVLNKLRDRTNYLIKSVDDTTIEDLTRIISGGVADNQDWLTVADTIQSSYPEISDYRAQLISRMETSNAYNLAHNDFLQKNNLGRIWVLDSSHDPLKCDGSCDENADAGVIAPGDVFPSGDDEPPSHVNCQCSLDAGEELPVDYIPNWLG